MAADSVFLALVYIPVTRGLAGTISTQHLGAVARRWPLFLLNGLVLTAAFMLLDFAVVGAPDTDISPATNAGVAYVFYRLADQGVRLLGGPFLDPGRLSLTCDARTAIPEVGGRGATRARELDEQEANDPHDVGASGIHGETRFGPASGFLEECRDPCRKF